MKVKREEVTVPRQMMSFPSLCSRCLGKTDLTSVVSKWKTSYMRDWPTKVTRWASVDIPICQSCKKVLIRKSTTNNAIAFAILTPLTWGIFLLMAAMPSVGEYITSFRESLGILGLGLMIFWGLLALADLGVLFELLNRTEHVEWPVKFVKNYAYDVKVKNGTWTKPSEWTSRYNGATFSFENETYARLFAASNPGSILGMHVDISNLQHSDWTVRKRAAETLGIRKDPEAVEPLIQALKDEDSNVRQSAAWALGAIGDARAMDALTEAKEDKSRWVRKAVNNALEAIQKK